MMSIGLTIHCEEGELEHEVYCQEVAAAAFAGLFDLLKAEGKSNLADYISDGEGDWGAEIAKLPDPSKPTPEEIAAIEAKLSSTAPADGVLAEAEKALAAVKAMDASAIETDRDALIQDMGQDLIPALQEAAEQDYEIELIIS